MRCHLACRKCRRPWSGKTHSLSRSGSCCLPGVQKALAWHIHFSSRTGSSLFLPGVQKALERHNLLLLGSRAICRPRPPERYRLGELLQKHRGETIATLRLPMALSTADNAMLQLQHTQDRLAANLVRLAEIEMDHAHAQEEATRLEAEIEAEAATLLNTVRTKAQASLAEAIAHPVGTEDMDVVEPETTAVGRKKEGPERKASSDTGSTQEPHTKRRHTGLLPEDDDLMPDDQMGVDAANSAVHAQEVPAYHSESPMATPFAEPAPTHRVGTENSVEPQHLALQQLIETNQIAMQKGIENSMAPMLEMLQTLQAVSINKEDLNIFKKRGQGRNESDDRC